MNGHCNIPQQFGLYTRTSPFQVSTAINAWLLEQTVMVIEIEFSCGKCWEVNKVASKFKTASCNIFGI